MNSDKVVLHSNYKPPLPNRKDHYDKATVRPTSGRPSLRNRLKNRHH